MLLPLAEALKWFFSKTWVVGHTGLLYKRGPRRYSNWSPFQCSIRTALTTPGSQVGLWEQPRLDRSSWSPRAAILPRQGQQEQVAQGLLLSGSEIHQGWKLHTLHDTCSIQDLATLTVKNNLKKHFLAHRNFICFSLCLLPLILSGFMIIFCVL